MVNCLIDRSSGCLICGAELNYSARASEKRCVLCGETFPANASCAEGHFVCDQCHSASAEDWIESRAPATAAPDPLELATLLMRNPSVKMHGPEHHFLVPAVLLSSYYHERGRPELVAAKIKEARRRAASVPGGSCGINGVCGAAVGVGIFVSLITEATPVSGREWRLSNQATAEALVVIARHGGPRCCKRNTFLALQCAVAFLEENLSVQLPINDPTACEFSSLNRQCRLQSCPFHQCADPPTSA
jgi:hypothetical protein